MLDVLGGGLADQAVGQVPVELAVLGGHPEDAVEELEDVLVRAEAQGPQEDGGQELLLPVEADVEVVLDVVLELDPGAPVGDDLGDEVALGLALAEEDAGRALQLADDDPLDAVEDEGPLLGHQRRCRRSRLPAP